MSTLFTPGLSDSSSVHPNLGPATRVSRVETPGRVSGHVSTSTTVYIQHWGPRTQFGLTLQLYRGVRGQWCPLRTTGYGNCNPTWYTERSRVSYSYLSCTYTNTLNETKENEVTVWYSSYMGPTDDGEIGPRVLFVYTPCGFGTDPSDLTPDFVDGLGRVDPI